MKKYDSAEFYQALSLEGSRICNDPIVEMGIRTSLAGTYQATNQLNKALVHLEKAFQLGLIQD